LKKKIPNIINIKIPYNQEVADKLFIQSIQDDYKKGYDISKIDFDRYCALLIKELGIEKLPKHYQEYCTKNNQLIDKIRYLIIRNDINYNKNILPEDDLFFTKYLNEKVKLRKAIVKNEIGRLGINSNKITFANSAYLRTLIKIVRELDDEITIIPWFISIKLSFEKFVHIYVKHVEETKFADGTFKNRTFFTYKYNQIWTLLKLILRQEEEDITDHFGEVAVGIALNEKDKIKDYHRGFKQFSDIIFNGDSFAMTIDTNGYIVKFYQKY